MSTYVCFDLDRECGDMERSWCDTCPKRKVAPECSNSPELRGIKSASVTPLPAAPAPTEQAGELPPLPEPFTDWRINRQSAFNADQMREYARAALAARRAPTPKASQ